GGRGHRQRLRVDGEVCGGADREGVVRCGQGAGGAGDRVGRAGHRLAVVPDTVGVSGHVRGGAVLTVDEPGQRVVEHRVGRPIRLGGVLSVDVQGGPMHGELAVDVVDGVVAQTSAVGVV